MPRSTDRRTFLAGLTGAAGTFLTTRFSLAAEELAAKPMPKRTLGKTNEKVSILGLGTAPMGHAGLGAEGDKIVHTALDQGINYIDTARIYDAAEPHVANAAKDRRDEMFLVTKAWANDAKTAEQQLTTSLKTLGVDHVDLCHVHSMGHRDPERVLADDGALAYLLKAKEKGMVRFVGATGHNRTSHCRAILETGKIDVFMAALNFVDRHIYDFQQQVLPVARKQGTAIVAMKVFGGPKPKDLKNFFASYPIPGPSMMPKEHLQNSIRYCLGLEGVATALAGVYNPGEILEDAGWAKEYRPLSDTEMKRLEETGKTMAPQWGERLGEPV